MKYNESNAYHSEYSIPKPQRVLPPAEVKPLSPKFNSNSRPRNHNNSLMHTALWHYYKGKVKAEKFNLRSESQ